MIDVAVDYNEDRTVDGWIDEGMDVFFSESNIDYR